MEKDKILETYYDHYKETSSLCKEAQSRRNYNFAILCVLEAVSFLMIRNPDLICGLLNDAAKEEIGNRTDDLSYDMRSGLKSVDDIAVEMQRTIRLARGTIKGLSLRHRLALLDFPVGYWIWRGRVMMRQGGLMVRGGRRLREGS